MLLVDQRKGFELLTNTNEVLVDGQRFKLSPKEMGVLELLMERRGDTVTRVELLEAIWGDRQANDQGLTQAVSKLRQILAKSDQISIQTIPKKGYLLQSRVKTGQRLALPTVKVNLNVVAILLLLFLIVVPVFIKRIEVRVDRLPPQVEQGHTSLGFQFR